MGRRCPENEDPLGSRLRLPPSAPRSSLPSSSSLHDAPRQLSAPDFRSPRHALPAPIAWHGIPKQPSYGGEKKATDRYTYEVNKSPILLLKVFESRIIDSPKNAADCLQPLQTKREPPHKTTRATFPKTGKRQDDPENRLGQTSYFAPILFH